MGREVTNAYIVSILANVFLKKKTSKFFIYVQKIANLLRKDISQSREKL